VDCHPPSPLQVDRKKIGFNEATWEANLELEGFLLRAAQIKELIEKKPTVTRAQSFQLHYNLKKSCQATSTLTHTHARNPPTSRPLRS
jgi:hypothetical protein